MSQRQLSEADVCFQLIEPALERAGWVRKQITKEYAYTDGRVHVDGDQVYRGKQKRADYVLYYKKPSIPLAILEAKKAVLSVHDGIQQALAYGEDLDVPFVFSSNGSGFYLHDRTGLLVTDGVERELTLDEFPSPEQLWTLYKQWRKLPKDEDEFLTQPNHSTVDGKTPRYYQQRAINRVVEAVARGQKRILLTMATGTGKTYTAFQILWKLWKEKKAQNILFLADRNILVDQTMRNDFSPFKGVMTKISRSLLDEEGRIDTSYQIYLTLYQAVIGHEGHDNLYEKFPPDFFDVICIDECHRGSADEDSQWRVILDYFSSATQIGLTATPKETKEVSNITYFGDPVYTYSLKQGIDDGFLAPFKVHKVYIDRDQEWAPEEGQTDDEGRVIEQRTYNQKDYDRTIVLPKRTEAVADHVVRLLHAHDPFAKTIIFCENIDHAERMRQAIINHELSRPLVQANSRYAMRITGDNQEGKAQLDHFIDPMSTYPVIATTSKLMTTGVDAKTCQLIVLDRTIKSMIEFKQIVGRGTRLHPTREKYYFTIVDFRKATELFKDEDWDGPPIVVIEAGGDDEGADATSGGTEGGDDGSGTSTESGGDAETGTGGDDEGGGTQPPRYKSVVSDVDATITSEIIQMYDSEGNLTTEKFIDYTRKTVYEQFASLDEFITEWSQAERKSTVIEELEAQGVSFELLKQEVDQPLDPFDLICHLVYNQPPLTRRERANNVKKRDVFTRYGAQAQKVLEAILDKYADGDLSEVKDISLLRLEPFTTFGTPLEIINYFDNGKAGYLDAVRELESQLYQMTA